MNSPEHNPSHQAPIRPAAAGLARLLRFLVSVPGSIAVLLIRLYQRTLSPALPVLTMGACACRFSPTCSHYAAEAVRTHGFLAGSALALARLVKCTPLHRGGFDPVPPRRAEYRCARVS